jgi:predicted molibdopterin-dependent oxidoreductase YjgC
MFRRLHTSSSTLAITLDGVALKVAPGDSVAAAVLASGNPTCRQTPVTGSDRAPFCMMGACFDCLVEIDGVPNRQACLVEVREGMQVRRQARPTPVTDRLAS